MKGGVAAFMGHEKEPPKFHKRRPGGKAPLVHSHSAKPHRKIITKHRMGKTS